MKHTVISYSNKKTGNIPSFSLPPVVTCSNCKECSKSCYALRMAKFHKSVGRCWEKNLQLWKESPMSVRYEILSASQNSRYFRYFVAGDIPDLYFLETMFDIAEIQTHCKFLVFTKKYSYINAYLNTREKPANLQIILSCWGEQKPRNPHNLPVSNVIFDKSVPSYGYVCGGNCGECNHLGVGCWQLQAGETVWFYKH